MINRATKLRWRRKVRRQYRQVEGMSVQAEAQLERHFFKRLSRLFAVRRFVSGWLLLVTLLIGGSIAQTMSLGKHYLELQPAAGGTYTEGVVGMFTSANPLYATTAADATVSQLVFSGLMKYDQQNKLVGDLAESIKPDTAYQNFTVTLRPNIYWHDGTPLTAEDVVFTYKTIQNPDARSPLFASWSGITIQAKDARTITFALPNTLSSFPHALVNGIVPQHILKSVRVDQLRADRFNASNPVGSGPFKWDAIEVVGASQETREERIGLMPYENYHNGEPRLQQFVVRTFRTEELMVNRYRSGELSGMSGLQTIPDDLDESEIHEYNIPITGSTMVFFKTSQPPFDDKNVRQALVQSVDVGKLIQSLKYPVVRARGPLLSSHTGYDPKLTQLGVNEAKALKQLDAAGWKVGKDGIRQKAGQRLSFRLLAQASGENTTITKYLQESWNKLGIEVVVLLQEDNEIRAAVSRHDYDALLYGISLGNDPDVFAYWHSSQAGAGTSRLNFSEYKSTVADEALEAGRTRIDAAVRAAKYKPFLQAWRDDAPAFALYQPRYLYVARASIHNFNPESINTSTDRFSNIENWMIRREKVTKPLN